MKKEENIKRAFDFLLKHGKSEKPFTLDEMVKATGWTVSTAKIYLGKKIERFNEEEKWRLSCKPRNSSSAI